GYFITPEKELLAADIYVQMFNYRTHPDNICWLIKKNGEYIGYVFGTIRKDEFEGIFYGLIPKYRGSRYSQVIQRFLKNFCREKGLKYFVNDVVFQNFPSLRSIIAENILPIDSYLNVCIKPFLQFGSQGPSFHVTAPCTSYGQFRQFALDQLADNEWLDTLNGTVIGNVKDIVSVQITLPVVTDKYKILVAQALNKENQLIAYIQCRILDNIFYE
ncbi:MAG: hypothetical protein JWO06_392, partial [Bacteroidota bacterium]|nr:hypothetical protein [Bacteroidota bacterium]